MKNCNNFILSLMSRDEIFCKRPEKNRVLQISRSDGLHLRMATTMKAGIAHLQNNYDNRVGNL